MKEITLTSEKFGTVNVLLDTEKNEAFYSIEDVARCMDIDCSQAKETIVEEILSVNGVEYTNDFGICSIFSESSSELQVEFLRWIIKTSISNLAMELLLIIRDNLTFSDSHNALEKTIKAWTMCNSLVTLIAPLCKKQEMIPFSLKGAFQGSKKEFFYRFVFDGISQPS